jgi:hypothetical protein
MLTEFQCLTLTGWGYVMQRTMDNTSPLAAAWFISLVVFTAYFAVQLFLAVLKTRFSSATAKSAPNAGDKPQAFLTRLLLGLLNRAQQVRALRFIRTEHWTHTAL